MTFNIKFSLNKYIDDFKKPIAIFDVPRQEGYYFFVSLPQYLEDTTAEKFSKSSPSCLSEKIKNAREYKIAGHQASDTQKHLQMQFNIEQIDSLVSDTQKSNNRIKDQNKTIGDLKNDEESLDKSRRKRLNIMSDKINDGSVERKFKQYK